MLAGNEVWNYLFFGLESTFLAFISLIPFSILVFLLFIKLKKIDKKSALILTPYLIWLIYDLSWTYYLWKLN
jgi:tryptophan-rich sensory protein